MLTFIYRKTPEIGKEQNAIPAKPEWREDCGVWKAKPGNSLLDGQLVTLRMPDCLALLTFSFQCHSKFRIQVKSPGLGDSEAIFLCNLSTDLKCRKAGKGRYSNLQKSAFLIVSPEKGTDYELDFQAGQGYRLVMVFLETEQLSGGGECRRGQLPPPLRAASKAKGYWHKRMDNGLRELVEKCFSSEFEGPGLKLALEASAKELTAAVIKVWSQGQKTSEEAMTASDRAAVMKSAEILRKEFVNPPLQRNLARQVGLNLNKLSACFQEIFGLTINKFVLKLKLEKARSILMSDQNLTVKAVAEKVGFNNTSYFIRKFREFSGETPGKYV